MFRTGYGASWLDFAATLVGRYTATPDDLLATPGRLRAWLTAWALTPASAVTQEDLHRARQVREALHRLARAAATGQAAVGGDVEVAAAALRDERVVDLRLVSGGLVLGRPLTTREALARLVREAVGDLTGPHAQRLRACGDDECSGIFLDPTGRRRWCSDERCGVRARVRAHRARRKAD